MKRGDLIRHIRAHGCVFEREGARHSIWLNPFKRKTSAVPHHTEIGDFLARKICRDLEVPSPK